MTWVVKNNVESEFFDSLKSSPDRVVGLMCGAVIEDRLKDALKWRWHDFKQADFHLQQTLFADGGILFNLGACIQLGFAVGLLSESAFRDLRYVTKIRNAFAHKLQHKDFHHQQIKTFTLNITAPDRFPIKDGGKNTEVNLKNIVGALIGHSSVSDMSDPRERFIRTTEIYSGLLMVAAHNPEIKKGAPEF